MTTGLQSRLDEKRGSRQPPYPLFVAAFDKALFEGIPDFSKSGCRAFSAFSGATLKRGIRFDVAPRDQVRRAFIVELSGAGGERDLPASGHSELRMPLLDDQSRLPFNPDLLKEIEDLQLSNRTSYWLEQLELKYVGDLIPLTEAELLRSPYASRLGLNEIKETLARRGLHLGMALENWPDAAIATTTQPDSVQAHVSQREMCLRTLEAGCRTLKQAMNFASDKLREQEFFRFELMARRKQSGVAATERVLSYSYGAFARYGDSIGLPFIWLLGFTCLFAIGYWVAAAGFAAAIQSGPISPFSPFDSEFSDALRFSLSRVFPLGAFEGVSRDWLTEFDAEHGAPAGTYIRIAATLESFLAAVLALAFGLAIRRKFQIG